MFGIGETELVLIVLFAFMIFGPDKLPGMGRTLGRALRQFRNAQEGFTQVVQTEIVDPAAEAMSDTPKRPNRKRSAELDEDADIDAPEGEGEESARPKRTETFAERKKRLAEEKAAREAAEKAAAATAADDSADSDADVAEGAPAQSAADGADEPAPAAPEEPSKPTLVDLYAMTPASKPKAADAADGDAAEAPAAEASASEATAPATNDEKEA